jgi:DNA-binding NarL/FixJ family response regulator
MIRALVIADSDAVLASLTATISEIPDVEVVGCAGGRSGVGHVARALRPDLVFIDQMCWPGLALARLGEVREACPGIAVVGLVESPDARWIVDGLRAGAAAVVPRRLSSTTLELVLQEVAAMDARPQNRIPRRTAA